MRGQCSSHSTDGLVTRRGELHGGQVAQHLYDLPARKRYVGRYKATRKLPRKHRIQHHDRLGSLMLPLLAQHGWCSIVQKGYVWLVEVAPLGQGSRDNSPQKLVPWKKQTFISS